MFAVRQPRRPGLKTLYSYTCTKCSTRQRKHPTSSDLASVHILPGGRICLPLDQFGNVVGVSYVDCRGLSTRHYLTLMPCCSLYDKSECMHTLATSDICHLQLTFLSSHARTCRFALSDHAEHRSFVSISVSSWSNLEPAAQTEAKPSLTRMTAFFFMLTT